jgi:hypothetical protein
VDGLGAHSRLRIFTVQRRPRPSLRLDVKP